MHPGTAATLLLMALPLALAPAARGETDRAYAESMVVKAHRLGLARDAQWLRLGHWRKHPLTGFRSEAAGGDFFVAPDGRTDPSAELDADLRAFFGVSGQPPAEVARGLMPPICRF